MPPEITIRSVTTQDGYRACEAIQRAAWGMGNDLEVVPAHMLRTSTHYGGLLLGAYTPPDEMAGFVFGFVGITHDERRIRLNSNSPIIHCSHMMGIHPDYQGQDIGTALKQAQRRAVMAQGHRLIVWTYDPLLGPNAHLNIEKLGATCQHYVRDAYGDLEGIYAGLPTDRFEVEWWIASQHVADHVEGRVPRVTVKDWLKAGAQIANPSREWQDDLRQPGEITIPDDGSTLLAEIPANFNAVRAADMGLARAWRLHARAVFEGAFEAGYTAARFARDETGRNYYVLHKDVDIATQAEREPDED